MQDLSRSRSPPEHAPPHRRTPRPIGRHRMSNRFTFAAMLGLAALAAPLRARAAPSDGPARAATLTGTVTDDASHQPIAGVQISIVGTTIGTQTDAQGRYRLAGVPAGPARLRARRIGYASSERD